MGTADSARALARKLRATGRRVVFAESCTAGMVAAALAQIPGISDYLCGSAVTYRERTKQDWLDVAADSLRQHSAVSAEVTREMALGVLRRTNEADFAAAVTGHLGPEAPPDLDGIIFVAVARRDPRGERIIDVRRVALSEQSRPARQEEASVIVLDAVAELMAE